MRSERDRKMRARKKTMADYKRRRDADEENVPEDPPVEPKVPEVASDDTSLEIFPREEWKQSLKAWELKAAVRNLIKSGVGTRKIVLIETLKELSLKDSKNANQYYHTVIFTPPYRCRCQPTELQWNFVKVKAAEEWTNESTLWHVVQAWVKGTQAVKPECVTGV